MVDDYYDLECPEDPDYEVRTQDVVRALEDSYDVPIYVVLNNRTYEIAGISSDGTEVWIHAVDTDG